MDTYRLVFFEDGIGEAKTIEFEAPDAARALTIAHLEAKERTAKLWKGDTYLCGIRRTGHDVWEIASPHSDPSRGPTLLAGT